MVIKAILVSILYYVSNAYSGFGGFYISKYVLCRPLVGGFLCGLIFGDMQAGLSLGIILQLAYMGVFAVGGAGSMDVGAVAYPCIAIALAANLDEGTAVAMTAAVAALSSQVTNVARFSNVFFNKGFKQAVEQGNRTKWFLYYNVLPQVVFGLAKMIPCFLLVYFGAEAVEAIVAALPETLLYGLGKFSKIMPAIGMGMLLKYMVMDKFSFIFFVFGFALLSYMGLNYLNIAIFAIVIAYLYFRTSVMNDKKAEKTVTNDNEEVL